MPWKDASKVDERYQFIMDLRDGLTMSEACRLHGIDRKTGYKWRSRFEEFGRSGLADRPRTAHHHPHALNDDIAALLVVLRRERPTWGPKKLLGYLSPRHPEIVFPAHSTVGELLRREGLSSPRKKRERIASYENPLAGYTGPNAVWCADFKGAMKTARSKSEPLTITDGTSRYCLRCDHLSANRTNQVKQAFTRAFREFGLPDAIRTDNGPPFATLGLAGLGSLSVWWIKLGIVPDRIQPGCPTQNSRHERLHRTLSEETEERVASTRYPQPIYDCFRHDYNYERPHEALNFKTPAQVYRPSPRHFPCKVKDPAYKKQFLLERLGQRGELFWRGKSFYLHKALANELVGIDIDSDEYPTLFFGPIHLGCLKNNRFWPRKKRIKKKTTPKKPSK